MASARKLGNDWLFRLGASDEPVLCQVSGSLTGTSEEIDATCKEDTSKFILSGKPGYEFTVTAELDEANTTGKYTFKQVVDALAADTTLDFDLGRSVTGDTEFTGTCKVGTWNLNTDLDDVPSWEATFRVVTMTIGVSA